ncbi:39S ribosomal protein L20, mitochondrial [Trichonephila inaurata madagascariensis]|uniref:39S ribosomal protein L20, mitochondrial n=1 Tax=Trichonephila inaurata madagascariensis TaxID=2747483 RepID=A0A8X7CA91_9ARAC|nr:39S ribosomal protein L20, mitochondrial [Trichonephila inaurata madagascariensis]
MTAHYFGRRRNCYSIAIKFLQKALRYTTVGRKIKPAYLFQLRYTRLDAAAAEHGLDYERLTQNLIKSQIQLSSAELQDLAIWEPRTFKSLTDIAKAKEKIEARPEMSDKLPEVEGVITRGML